MSRLEYDSPLSGSGREHLLGEYEIVSVTIISDIDISGIEALSDDRLCMSPEPESHIEDSERLSYSSGSDTLSPLWIEELDDGSEKDAGV